MSTCASLCLVSTPLEDVNGVMDAVRARVKELRGRKGWSGADLGEQLSKLGVPWNRSVVANFESGRRPAVSVQELLALALVLDVAPVNLLVPLHSEPYQVTPKGTDPQNALDVWSWMRGSGHFLARPKRALVSISPRPRGGLAAETGSP